MSAVLSTYAILDCGRVTKTDLSLVETEPMRFCYVLTHDVDSRTNGTGHDQYVFVWDATSEDARRHAYRQMGILAADKNVRLNWHDVARMQWLTNTIGQPIDPLKYAGFRQQS